jgi:hypothetical protein
MTARAGLSDLLTTLRGMTEAGTADYTLGTQTYWSDDHLQLVLDRHRTDLRNQYAAPQYKPVPGGFAVYDYVIGVGNLEYGTALAVEDGVGNAYGTATYTVDAQRGVVTFTADKAGAMVTVTGRSFDLEAAAADVWTSKAAHVAQAYDFSTDNHKVSRSQMRTACLDMARYYRAQAAVTSVSMDRSDTAGHFSPLKRHDDDD